MCANYDFDTVIITEEVYYPFTHVQANSMFGAGNAVKSALSGSLGRGYSVSTIEFGTDVVVYVRYTNDQTGKEAGSYFLIKLTGDKTANIVKSSAVRYRTSPDISTSINYIRQRATELRNLTTTQ